jgi:hypothetical protein
VAYTISIGCLIIFFKIYLIYDNTIYTIPDMLLICIKKPSIIK